MFPVPQFALKVEVDVESSNEELILFLGTRSIFDPIPSNVITEIHPFSIDPRNSPENIWFLYNSNISQSYIEGSIIKVENGYWRCIDNLKIITSTPTVGRKTTREFFLGEAPSGYKTELRMHEYCTEPMVAQDVSALCRFFSQNDEVDNAEQCGTGGVNKESPLPSLVNQQERNSSSKDSAIQVAIDNEERQPELPNNLVNMEAGYEDFFELIDIENREESSDSSSENTSVMSMDSDEGFDVEAMLRDIENGGVDINENVDYKLSIAASVRSDQVVVQPPQPSGNPVVMHSNSIPVPNPAHSLSTTELRGKSDVSMSGSSQESVVKLTHSRNDSEGSSSSGRPRSRSARRLTKLRKSYCCFSFC